MHQKIVKRFRRPAFVEKEVGALIFWREVIPLEYVLSCDMKINLCLWVGQLDADGYHPVRTLFLRLRSPEFLRLRSSDRFRLFHRGDPFYGEHIVERAATMVYDLKLSIPQVEVECVKALPAGGGVGAGSGNAGAFLRWAFYSAGRPVDMAMAAKLGSDVPFLASEMNLAWAEGRGEVLSPVSAHTGDIKCLVGFPVWPMSTSLAYHMLDQMRPHVGPLPERDDFTGHLNAIEEGRVVGLLPNDFLIVSEKIREEYIKIWTVFEASGALGWGLCGSGSGFFGLFKDHDCLNRAARMLGSFGFVKSLMRAEVIQ
ncbi:4-(cytidine 5'-diphospho)-2-C-methyl-D-erythritol kinase [Thermanaerovibrio velox]|uniref:4-(cytidine 5'-diphospho)-2-C-methyl-D-erythritol kinase n=1 Tax=Thermanaerovibrio velox TaxID=108007 RepID=UPI0002D79F04|nr:4-diphosphocytidyl-2C-methyl-D-erythritol kinase [Thermanaerovibrio velox]